MFSNIITLLAFDKIKSIHVFFIVSFIALFDFIGIGIIAPIIDLVLSDKRDGILIPLINTRISQNNILILILIFYILRPIITSLLSGMLGNKVFSLKQEISSLIFVRSLKKGSLEREDTASVIRDMSIEQNNFVNGVIIPIATLVTELMISLFLLIFLFSLNPKLTLASIGIMVPLSFVFFIATRRFVWALGLQRRQKEAKQLAIVRDALLGIEDVKVYQLEQLMIKRYLDLGMKIKNFEAKQFMVNRFPKYGIETLILLGAIFFISSQKNNFINLDFLTTTIVFTIAIVKIVPSLHKILSSLNTLSYSSDLIQKVTADIRHFDNRKPHDKNNVLQSTKCRNEYILKNVKVSFSDHHIIGPISLSFTKGDFIAVVGDSGSGKSTVLKIFSGLINRFSGSAQVPDTLDLSKISYLSQSPFLFAGTVSENISLKEASELTDQEKKKIDDLFGIVGLKHIDKSVEVPVDLYISENGQSLSGGQRQRIGLARALFAEPSLLLLDEPTSALQSSLEKIIIQNLRKWKRSDTTIVLVTHSQELIESGVFNRIIRMEGKHAEGPIS